jgi:transcriptional regulator MraZ
MPALKTNAPTDYAGHYRHGVDNSRRVMVPARWRPRDPNLVFTLLPWPLVAPECVLVLPPARWSQLLERLGENSLGDPQAAAVERAIAGNALHQSLDRVGRLFLSDALCQAAGLGREVEMVGRLDKFEIWEPGRYEALRAGDNRLAMAAVKGMKL